MSKKTHVLVKFLGIWKGDDLMDMLDMVYTSRTNADMSNEKIERIWHKKKLLIIERNKILDNWFKRFFGRKKLADIDAKIDELDECARKLLNYRYNQ